MADFRVIIVGGGIGGLTLANCLQHANIDFVLLESREKIGMHVGAGVGIDPPAARIFDQLGVFSDLESLFAGTAPTRAAISRDLNGKYLGESHGYALSEARTGYPCAFYKRPAVLQTLFKHIKDKDKVFVNKRVRKITYENSKPIVACEDGSTYSGDIVVGCDGVHSVVRKEMWRITDKEEPGKIPSSDKNFLTANWRGMYCISGPVRGLDTGVVQVVLDRDEAFYWFVLKDGRVMWCLVEKLDKEYRLPNIPRYTDEDARVWAESKLNKVLVSDTADQVRFGDVWKSVETVALVPIEEGDLKVWTSGKIVCVGDSVHKVTPESGIGTTIVTETVASLANHLKRLVDNSSGKPTSVDIEACLKSFETHRHPRASMITKFGLQNVRVFTLANRKIRRMLKYLVPLLGGESTQTEKYIAAEKVDFLPVPPRSLNGTMAFNPTQGHDQKEPRKPRAVLALPLLLLAANAFRNKEVPTFVTQMLNLPLFLIMLMEGSRRAYLLNPIQWPLLFSVLSYFLGITTIVDFWLFFHYSQSPVDIFGALDQRLLQVNYAKTLLPTILIGAVLPALIVTAYPEAELAKSLHFIWPMLPIALVILHRLFASLVKDSTSFDRFYRVKADLPSIRRAVIPTAFVVATLFNYNRISGTGPQVPALNEIPAALRGIIGSELGGCIWIVLLFKDLKKARMINTSWLVLLIGYFMAVSLIGSGATLLAAWLWREEILATKRHWAAVTKQE
ncbi:FAD/NAD(P)-binding domain-containing protein [Stipitochalara longipes BDJ]|nr:FAD/NAD(P)-binding domain-containing protein [Stipitochalara longipes BDJ]